MATLQAPPEVRSVELKKHYGQIVLVVESDRPILGQTHHILRAPTLPAPDDKEEDGSLKIGAYLQHAIKNKKAFLDQHEEFLCLLFAAKEIVVDEALGE